MSKTKRPDYKKQLEDSKAELERAAKYWSAKINQAVASNNQAVKDVQELIRLKRECAVAHQRLDEAVTVIEKRLRDSHLV